MGTVLAVFVVVLVLGATAVLAVRRTSRGPAAAPTAHPAPPRPAAPPPMTGLAAALDQVTDRGTGRPMRERLDLEDAHIAELRSSDDTGPLLGRALDAVAHHDASSDHRPAAAGDGAVGDGAVGDGGRGAETDDGGGHERA